MPLVKYISSCVRRPRIHWVLYQWGKFFNDYFADHLHLAAEFGARIFGDAGKESLHIAELVGNVFDFVAECGGNVFHFAAELGTDVLDLFGGFGVHFCDPVCQHFECIVNSAFHLVCRIIIAGRERALVFRDFLKFFLVSWIKTSILPCLKGFIPCAVRKLR